MNLFAKQKQRHRSREQTCGHQVAKRGSDELGDWDWHIYSVCVEGGWGGGISHLVVPTLRGPMDYSPIGSSVHGISQARILEWTAIPFSRGSSQSRDRIRVSCIVGRFLPSELPRKPQINYTPIKKNFFNALTLVHEQQMINTIVTLSLFLTITHASPTLKSISQIQRLMFK